MYDRTELTIETDDGKQEISLPEEDFSITISHREVIYRIFPNEIDRNKLDVDIYDLNAGKEVFSGLMGGVEK